MNKAKQCLVLQVSMGRSHTEDMLDTPLLRAERPRLTERDLICDLSIHHGIARKAMQDWKDSAGKMSNPHIKAETLLDCEQITNTHWE